MLALQVILLKAPGGAGTALLHYARMFEAAGVKMLALWGGPGSEALAAEGGDVVEAPAALVSPLLGLTPDFGRLRAVILARMGAAPDLIVAHTDRALAPLAAMFPAAKLIAPCHSDKAKHKRRADLVVTLNAKQHALVQSILAGSRARVALLGNPFVAPEVAAVSAEGPARINFCARFIPTKDPETVLRAGALLSRPLPMRMIGAGELEGELRRLAKTLGLDVEFPGWRSDPFADFTRGDILVLPSEWEGLPYLLQEALARGVSILASDIAGNRAALTDGAYGDLVPYQDAEALARLIEKAVADPARLRAMAETGRTALNARYGASAFWAAFRNELQI